MLKLGGCRTSASALRSMLGDAQTKGAGLDQSADIS
jgi:hypothetical protein